MNDYQLIVLGIINIVQSNNNYICTYRPRGLPYPLVYLECQTQRYIYYQWYWKGISIQYTPSCRSLPWYTPSWNACYPVSMLEPYQHSSNYIYTLLESRCTYSCGRQALPLLRYLLIYRIHALGRQPYGYTCYQDRQVHTLLYMYYYFQEFYPYMDLIVEYQFMEEYISIPGSACTMAVQVCDQIHGYTPRYLLVPWMGRTPCIPW